MSEVKPKKSKKRLVELPPQASANDTSNWEGRNVSAVSVDLVRKKRVVRDVEFIRPKSDNEKMPREMRLAIKRLEAQERAKKSSK